MASFTSFGAVASYWTTHHDVKKARDEALTLGTERMYHWIREQHGGGNTTPPSGALQTAIKGHSRPLFQTGKLQSGVTKKRLDAESREIYQKDTFLGPIHEYGRTYTAKPGQSAFIQGAAAEHLGVQLGHVSRITIPARPIWGRAKSEEGPAVLSLMKKIMVKHLTN